MTFDLPMPFGPAEPLAGWVYLVFALVVALEGPLTVLAGAVAASAGYLDPTLVFLSACCGNLAADCLWYTLGYLGKIEWLLKYGGWLGVREPLVRRLQRDIHRHIHGILFTAKLTLGFVIPTLVAAGLARVPFRRWFGVLFVAECIWTGSLLLVGYHFGRLVRDLETGIRWLSLAAAAVFLILLGVYLARRRSSSESS
jgi:membrane protein DedA with SNARE-associated domain